MKYKGIHRLKSCGIQEIWQRTYLQYEIEIIPVYFRSSKPI